MLKRISIIGLMFLMCILIGGIVILNSPIMQPIVFKYQQHHKMFTTGNVKELLRSAYFNFDVPKLGIIHVGARYAEELDYYKSHGIKNILWIEADPEAEAKLRQVTAKHHGSKVAIFAATDTNGVIDLYKTANDGYSSSILKLKNHLVYFPGITQTKVINVPQKRLDDYIGENSDVKDLNYNMLVMDIQGAELIALKGATKTLANIDAIITEINYNELYEGAAFIKNLDYYLADFDFVRVDSASSTHFTGDALYIKEKFFKA